MVKGLLKLTRVGEYYGSVLILTGVSLVANHSLSLSNRGLLLISLLLLNIFCFAINDIEDADDDFHDATKKLRNPISAGIIGRGVAHIFAWLTVVIGLILLIPFGLLTLIAGLAIIILGFLYSYKPVRLKSVPFLDLLSHGLFLGGLQSFIIISANNNPVSQNGFVIIFLIFIGSLMGDINNEIRDHEVDRKTQIKNTASVLNLQKLGPLMHFLSVIPFGLLFLIVFLEINNQTRLITLAISFIIGMYYLITYASRRRRGFYDKHGQQLISLLGLILVLLG